MKSFLIFLSRHKTYTAINVLGLSLSMMFVILIGAYTWQEYHVDAQFPNADRILVYGFQESKGGTVTQTVSGGHWRLQQYLRSRYPEIESSTAVYGGTNVRLGYIDKEGNRTTWPTLFVDSTFFTLLGVQLELGDAATALADGQSAVITEDVARSFFGSPEKAMGQQLNLEGAQKVRVKGVVKRMEHSSLPQVGVYLPFRMTQLFNPNLTNEQLSNASGAEVLLLQRKGAHLEQRLADLDRYQRQFFWIFRQPGSIVHTTLTPLRHYYFSKLDDSACLQRGDRRLVNVLLLVGLVILLFAVFNYVNLTNALSDQRAREMAMRRLVGASRGSIVRRLMAESVVLCAISMAIALALAWAATPYTCRLLDTHLTLLPESVGGRVAVAALLVGFTLVLGIVAGALPAGVLSKAKPIDVVRGTFHFSAHQRLTKAFIIVQNTATIVLIALAFAMSAQIHHLVTAYRGFNTRNLIEVPLGFSNVSAEDYKVIDAWYDGLRQLPQVVGATACQGTPYSGGNNLTFSYGRRTISSQTLVGDANYIKIFGLKVNHPTGLRNRRGDAVYVNRQMLAEESLPMQSRYYYYSSDSSGALRQVVSGVLSDFTIRGLDEAQHPLSLTISDSVRYQQWSTVIQVQGDPVTAYQSVQKLFKQLFNVPLDIDRPFLDQQIADDYSGETRVATILRLFAFIAVVISVLGLMAMSTYYISGRRKEIAVRKVFGSTSGEVSRRFIRRFLSYVVVAFVIAVPVIIGLYGHWVAQYSHRAVWWPWIPVAGLIVLAVSYAAVFVQVRHASRQNPAKNLKAE